MHRTILLMICLISVASADAQRQRMTSEVHYFYDDSIWRKGDSISYQYHGNMGSVNMSIYEHALGYDRCTSYSPWHGKYDPHTCDSIDYDSAGHPVLHTSQINLYKNKWLNRKRYILDCTPQGDTVSCVEEKYDEKQKIWRPKEGMRYSYYGHGRQATSTKWTNELYHFEIGPKDSFYYNENGLLSRHANFERKEGMRWQIEDEEDEEYDAEKKLICTRSHYKGKSYKMDTMIYDTAGRMLSETFYNMYAAANLPFPTHMSCYSYDNNSVVRTGYSYPGPYLYGVVHMSMDSTYHDVYPGKMMTGHHDSSFDSLPGADALHSESQSIRVKFKKSWDEYQDGPEEEAQWQSGGKTEAVLDAHGLPLREVHSYYDPKTRRWLYQGADLYRYEPVPER